MFHSIYSVTWVSARTNAVQQSPLFHPVFSTTRHRGLWDTHNCHTSPSPDVVSFHKSCVDHPFVVILWSLGFSLFLNDLVDADDHFHCVNVCGPLLGLHLVKTKVMQWVGSCNMYGCFIITLESWYFVIIFWLGSALDTVLCQCVQTGPGLAGWWQIS